MVEVPRWLSLPSIGLTKGTTGNGKACACLGCLLGGPAVDLRRQCASLPTSPTLALGDLPLNE